MSLLDAYGWEQLCGQEEPKKKKTNKKCKYCEYKNNDFVILNETTDYSSIEMALNRQGMLRVRYYDDSSQVWFSQDIINIKFCPICGRKII